MAGVARTARRPDGRVRGERLLREDQRRPRRWHAGRLGSLTPPLTGQIVLGTATFGIHAASRDRDADVAAIRAALDAGIRVFDTARAYAPFGDPGYAERLLADALAGEPDVLVITKGGHWRDGDRSWAVDNSPARLRADVATSLRELRAERLDLFLVHRADDPTVPVEQSVAALAGLRDAGLIAAIGLSNVTPEHVERAAAVTSIDAVQNPAAGDDTLAVCDRLGIAHLVYSPLAVPVPPALAELATRRGVSAERLLLRGLLAASPQRSVVTGATRAASIADSAAAVHEEWDAEAAAAFASAQEEK